MFYYWVFYLQNDARIKGPYGPYEGTSMFNSLDFYLYFGAFLIIFKIAVIAYIIWWVFCVLPKIITTLFDAYNNSEIRTTMLDHKKAKTELEKAKTELVYERIKKMKNWL